MSSSKAQIVQYNSKRVIYKLKLARQIIRLR